MTMPNDLVPAGHRAANGRFLKGCQAGPGNPYVRQIARLKSALYLALTEGDIEAVARRMVEAALGGDVAAARLVMEYSIGKPVSGTLATVVDAEATRRLDYDALSVEELRSLCAITEKLQGASHDDGCSRPLEAS